ncbi:hypothetical protein [Lishizhenia sp.]|uniref:hypothetical protein n=1 Tax=Lishizhenia sp. TaxID=2497594 RepID=UPI00299D8AF5|nr:hypothetical protein [Lishizhenia sp.]MDX1446239.1 hypothetical protein [Lishizhenia sp.]
MAFNRFDHSVLGEIRPRFELKIDLDPDQALQHLEDKAKGDPTVVTTKSRHYIFLKIPTAEQHYWSPELSVRIEKEEFSEDILVHCLLGPKPSVWLFFMFCYAFIVILSTIGGIFSLVKYQQYDDASWLWVIPAGIVLTVSIFFTSKFGQNKGRDQMLHLVSFLYHGLDDVTSVERIHK